MTKSTGFIHLLKSKNARPEYHAACKAEHRPLHWSNSQLAYSKHSLKILFHSLKGLLRATLIAAPDRAGDDKQLEGLALEGLSRESLARESSPMRESNLVHDQARQSSNSSVYTVSLDEGGGQRGDNGSRAGPTQRGLLHTGGEQARPAVLRWSKLGYYVRDGIEGGDTEMAVLRGVSGFAGPEPGQDTTGRGVGGGALGRSGELPATTTAAATASVTSSRPEGLADHTSSGSSGGGDGVSVSDTGSANPSTPHEGPACNGFPPNSVGAPSPTVGGQGCDVPSTITGILGPSGAGKSSLLDLLAGRKRRGEGRATGSISLTHGDRGRGRRGGRGGPEGEGLSDAERSADAVRRVGGYVCQEDVLPGTLTCYEHLMFHARLRMPPGASFAERAARVLWVIDELGLGRVADSRIGDELERGLSGGERRRLSIAAELVAQPALLFLDEPTTGLGEKNAFEPYWELRGEKNMSKKN